MLLKKKKKRIMNKMNLFNCVIHENFEILVKLAKFINLFYSYNLTVNFLTENFRCLIFHVENFLFIIFINVKLIFIPICCNSHQL